MNIHTNLERRPAALQLKDSHQHRDTVVLTNSILGHLGTRVTAGDMLEGTQGSLNDLLTLPSIGDSTKKSLRVQRRGGLK